MKTDIIRHGQSELEAWALHECETAKEHCKVNGSSDGGRNQPPLSSKRINPFIEEHRLRFQAIIDRINGELLFRSTYDGVVQHRAATEEQLRDNHQRHVAAREQLVAANAAVRGLQPEHGKWRMVALWGATIAVTSFEALLSEQVFEGFGYPTLVAGAASLLFAGALAAAAHTLPAAVNLGKTRLQKRLIAGFAAITLTGLFVFLGCHRAAYAEAQMAHEGILSFHVSPLSFILLSWLLFSVAALIHHLYYPSRAERERQRTYERALDAKRQCDEACENLSKEHNAITRAHDEVRSRAAAGMEQGHMLEQMVINAAHQGLAIYRKHNLLARPDGIRPACLDEPHTMQFNTHFHSIKDL